MEKTFRSQLIKGIPVSIPVGELNIRTLEEEGSPCNFPVNPFPDDGILEFLEGTDKGPVGVSDRIQSINRVETAGGHII
jgi:hypothetical protein